MDKDSARLKKENLIKRIKKFPSMLIAFSGGVDSTFLLAVAHQVLGESVLAATADSRTFTEREREAALLFTRQRGIHHIIFQSSENGIPEFISNTPDRCYHCKKALSEDLLRIASERDIRTIAHGANLDDLDDYRPGLRAADEMGLISPLMDAKLGKEEIRFLSREMGLDTWDKPALACLASRIPYGSAITPEKLEMIERAEEFLLANGIRQFRVRHHGQSARIEVEDPDIVRFMDREFRENIVKYFHDIGFTYVSLDLEGYVSGSMNKTLNN